MPPPIVKLEAESKNGVDIGRSKVGLNSTDRGDAT